jgi:hypothetical protein
MNCAEAAEFVSALCDGEIIPSEAAAHIGGCELCQERLREYSAIGVEMRRVASLETPPQLAPQTWRRSENRLATLWQKGWESMRIPKFAFALLVIAVVALASSLAVSKVGAHSEGNVVFLRIDTGTERPVSCALSTVDKKNDVCMAMGPLNGMFAEYRIKLLNRDANRVRIDIRSKVWGPAQGLYSTGAFDLDNVAGQEYWFEPGNTLKVDIPEAGTLAITGEWMDHLPVMPFQNNEAIDPGAGELRVSSPLLIRDNAVVGDLEGAMTTLTKPEGAAQLYFQDQGDFTISSTQMKDSLPADVFINRISFKDKGHTYIIVTAAPVVRGTRVWVLHRAEYKPVAPRSDNSFLGSVDLHKNDAGEWTTPIPMP